MPLIPILRLARSENWQRARDSPLRKSATGSKTGDKGTVQLNTGIYHFPEYFDNVDLILKTSVC